MWYVLVNWINIWQTQLRKGPRSCTHTQNIEPNILTDYSWEHSRHRFQQGSESPNAHLALCFTSGSQTELEKEEQEKGCSDAESVRGEWWMSGALGAPTSIGRAIWTLSDLFSKQQETRSRQSHSFPVSDTAHAWVNSKLLSSKKLLQ